MVLALSCFNYSLKGVNISQVSTCKLLYLFLSFTNQISFLPMTIKSKCQVPKPQSLLHKYLQVDSITHRRRQWQPTPVLLPGKSHGPRSLVGCSPWGREELDMTKQLSSSSSSSSITHQASIPNHTRLFLLHTP